MRGSVNNNEFMDPAIPKGLPESKLVKALAERATNRKDTAFPFLQRLDDFRLRVSGEVQFINQLFPEYTPHDANYHLSRLFHVADKCLTKTKLDNMNSAELFVLACGLYGHDWGMAVSDTEKEYILTGKLPLGAKMDDIWVLGDEQARLEHFAEQHKIVKDPDRGFIGISLEMWRSYVRTTHALRSGERTRRYFRPYGEGISEALGRVCEGHWLDFSEIRDDNYFPQDFSVLGESVNLRAIAIYVRLVDLLDIADDRTPYVIWKFVAPKDSTSKMEWEKHRSLQPVTFPNYQQGRIIQFDGSTEDHEVFAALEDLKVYCEDQLKECKDTLALMNDPRHFLDIYHISWRVVSRGFKTPCIRFEFDRTRMFEILSSQIYQGNPYVFLRELLQNSIDAIRMRRRALMDKKIEPGDLGTVNVTIDHKDNGDVVITWSDDGVGMDEYIVKNFLAIAGKSYYSSKEFEHLGLTFDPVSKFGIGILSCFLVSDRIEIETRRDLYVSPHARPLRIRIPDIEKHFRVENGPSTTPFGTTVTVYLRGDKLKAYFEKLPSFTHSGFEESRSFEPVEYLSRIAGFVEFPIVVTERGKTTIILHPQRNLPKHLSVAAKDAELRRLDLGICLEEAVQPQDVTLAKKYLRQEQISIEKDLQLAGYEGAITYLVLSSDHYERYSQHNRIRVVNRSKPREIEASIRLSMMHHSDSFPLPSKPRDGSIFRDGIRVVGTMNPNVYQIREGDMKGQKKLTNLTSMIKAEIDVSRNSLLGASAGWESTVDEALMRYFKRTWIDDAMNKPLLERVRLLSAGAARYNLSCEQLWNIIEKKNWPIPLLIKEGQFAAKTFDEAHSIAQLPVPLIHEASKVASQWWFSDHTYDGAMKLWTGEPVAISGYALDAVGAYCDSVGMLPQFFNAATEDWCRSIRFLRGPWEDGPDLVQEISFPRTKPLHEDLNNTALKAMAADADNVTIACFDFLHVDDEFGNVVVPFPAPHEHAFAYGWEWFNLSHPVVKRIIRLWAIRELAESENKLSKAQLGALNDIGRIFGEVESGLLATKQEVENAQKSIDATAKLLVEFGLLSKAEPRILLPRKETFISGTFSSRQAQETHNAFDQRPAEREFGEPLA
ncbi:MAG: ATP-binding protein [Verrucomicrobiales bacterium]|nr:ATP-binding protein [Verrucomicrobiales bacterium]